MWNDAQDLTDLEDEYDPIEDREGPDDAPPWLLDPDDEEMDTDADTHCA